MINGAAASYQPYQNYNNYNLFGAQRAQNAQAPSTRTTLIPAARPEVPVTPVTPVRASAPVQSGPLNKTTLLARWENDPAAMAVRSRIQYGGGGEEQAAPAEDAAGAARTPGDEDGEKASRAGAAPEKDGARDVPGAAEEEEEKEASDTKSAQETMEEAECQTCKKRKYQDGSDDPGVSFKTAGHIDPDQAAAVVRGHEQEHVVREQAKASRENREVVSQSVTLHTGICPECGRAYVSGGTTRTVTRAAEETSAAQAQARAEAAEGGEDAA